MEYQERMEAIEKRDRARRFLREYDADTGEAHVDYAHSRNLTGEPTEHNRVHRASVNSWERMERPTWSAVTWTLPDGTVVHAAASAFRPERTATKATKVQAPARETAQERRVRLLAKVGNNSDVD